MDIPVAEIVTQSDFFTNYEGVIDFLFQPRSSSAVLSAVSLCVFASLRAKTRLTQRRKVAKKTRHGQDLLAGKVRGKVDVPEEITR